MNSRKSRSPKAGAGRPLSFDDIVRIRHEPPTQTQPRAMREFAGLNGLFFERPAGREPPKAGFTPVAAGIAAWALSVSHPYRLGLPLQQREILSRARSSGRTHVSAPPLHHPWNARCYHPVPAAFAETVGRNARGERVIPTAPDAQIFGTDDRKPYYPDAYPWLCIGRLESESGTPMGTGALVGRNLVLTARHVVRGNTAAFKFVPGYYNGQSTLGSAFFSWVKTAEYYEGSDAGAWDFALLSLYQPLGDQLGYFGVRTYDDDWNDLNVWAAAGYPSMAPFNNVTPSYLIGFSIDDTDDDGDATELDSESQDSSKGNSGGPVWAVWPDGAYVVGTTSANSETDFGIFGSSYWVMNASGKAMVDMIALARLQVDTDIHVKPPDVRLTGG
ncbi:MAG TPA: trypsin-like serine protease [Rhizomicrobium sp.]|nr:trypsin-like serine protease [Rhizomicrobium sp.]